MSEFKHTPGPWEIHKLSFSDSIRIFSGTKYLGSIGNSDDDPVVTKANVKLMAAAPDLLEALLHIIKYDGNKIDSIGESLTRSAIEKAMGDL